MSLYFDDVYLPGGNDELDPCEVVAGFHSRYGSHSFGRVESDPEMLEYEELIDLGLSLSQ